MTWPKRFLARKVESFVPLVPSQESKHWRGSSWDKPLVPTLSQPCPIPYGGEGLGQGFGSLGQKPNVVLSQLKPASRLALDHLGTNGTNGTRQKVSPPPGLPSSLLDLWEERAGILEFEAGFSRAEAEIRAREGATQIPNLTNMDTEVQGIHKMASPAYLSSYTRPTECLKKTWEVAS